MKGVKNEEKVEIGEKCIFFYFIHNKVIEIKKEVLLFMKKQKCAFLGYVTIAKREDYEVVYEGTVCLVEDVKEIPDFDILYAGIPVQSFSVARRGSISAINPFDDLMKIVKKKKPKQIVLENVGGLQLYNRGETLKAIRNSLNSAGYMVTQEKDMLTSRYFVRAVAA